MADDLVPFQFYMPLTKSRKIERRHGEELWVVQGIAATDQEDMQKERLLLEGMDFSPYLRSGVVNYNHQDSPDAILGEPLEARIIWGKSKGEPNKFFNKAWLYKHQPKSQALWNHLCALEKGEQPFTRGMGWSVQGGVTERKGNLLVKSVVRAVAITPEPINEYTWARCVNNLVKSLAGVGLGQAGYPPIGQAVSDLRPLAVQNLDATVTKLIYDPCKYDCFDKANNNFRNGYHGLLDHLVLCKSVPVNDAKQLVSLLVH